MAFCEEMIRKKEKFMDCVFTDESIFHSNPRHKIKIRPGDIILLSNIFFNKELKKVFLLFSVLKYAIFQWDAPRNIVTSPNVVTKRCCAADLNIRRKFKSGVASPQKALQTSRFFRVGFVSTPGHIVMFSKTAVLGLQRKSWGVSSRTSYCGLY